MKRAAQEHDLLNPNANHRVAAVIPLEGTEDVYDLTVPKYHNFVCNGVVVHNSALDIYADDATQQDSETRHTVWFESEESEIKAELEKLFYDRLNIEEDVWEITRTLCKYGDDYEEIVVGDDGVVGLNYLAPATMRRVESDRGALLGFVQTFDPMAEISAKQFEALKIPQGAAMNDSKTTAIFEGWRIAHMRMRSKTRDSLYGWSVIDPARWVWKRLALLEDAVMVYKLTRSPSRYAFYIDVGNLPRRQAERAIEDVKNKIKKHKFVNPRTGKLDMRFNPLSFDEDFFLGMRDGKESTRVDVLSGPAYQQVEDVQYFLNKLYAAIKIPKAYLGYDENMPSKATLCLAGDTKIPLMDGTAPTIAELSKREDPFWVYSVDKENNVVPGLARDARVTRRQAQTVEVELDNGEVLTCTPDHPIMTRDGSFKEAQELVAGESVMPLYRRRSTGKMVDYEEVYHPGKDEWGFTHRAVTDALFEDVPKGHVRHHVNFDRNDNRPENLKVMSWGDHSRLHGEHAEKTLLRPDVMEKRKAAQAEWLKTDAAKVSIAKASAASKKPGSRFWDWVHSDRHREMKSDQMRAQWEDPDSKMRTSRTSEWRKKMSRVMKGRIENGTAPDSSGENNRRWRSDASIEHLISVASDYRCSSKKQLMKWSGYSEALVSRVLSGAGMTYREFADKHMAPSKMRDASYRRVANHKVVEVRQGPVVDTYDLTVDGYHNFAVEQGVIVHNSQEDVRFARTILRVQRETINGYKKIARVHLAAKKIDPMAVNFNIHMTVPSAIFELGQMEVRRARADLAAGMERHVSLHWMLSNIYGMSDDEIEEISKQKKKDSEAMAAQGGQGFESIRGDYRSPLIEARGISERELFAGNKEHEKRTEEFLKREMEKVESRLGARLRENAMLLRDIAHATPRGRR
jgi:intein/homing endonuclease